MRTFVWLVLAAVLTLVALCVPSALGSDSTWDGPAALESSDGMFDDPSFRAMLARAASADLALQTRRESRAGQAEVAESETAFDDLSRSESLTLARQEFPGLMKADLGELDLPAGDRVVGYEAPNVAQVVDEDGEESLIVGTRPFAAQEGGDLESLDLGLVASDEGFVPEHPAVEVTIPGSAEGMLRVEGADVGVRVAGARPVVGSVADDRVFYPEVLTDTDFASMATPAGAEFVWQLRSVDAPQVLGVDVDLPDGASMRLSSDLTSPGASGEVEVVRDNEVIATISAPIAADADGVSVPASFRFQDGRLVVDVAHQGMQTRYPVMVDPEVRDVWGQADLGTNCGGGATNFAPGRWTFQEWGTPMGSGCGNFDGQGGGLFLESAAWTYTDGSHGQWIWSPPAGAYIMSVWFDGLRHRAAGTHLYTGLYGQTWGSVSDHHGDFNNANWTNTPDSPYNAWSAVVGLWLNGTYARPHTGTGVVRGVNIRLGDLDPPTVRLTSITGGTSGPGTQVTPWTRDNTAQAVVHAYDGGLGIKHVNVVRDGSGQVIGGVTHGCVGHRSSPCPRTWQPGFAINTGVLPEGLNAVQTRAIDIVDNPAWGPHWLQRIDRTGPTINLSGELVDHATDGRLGANPSIYVHAIDGSTAGPLTQQSGVKRVRLLLDDAVREDYVAPEGGCDNCDRGLSWSIPFSSLTREHLVTIEAWDYVGHRSAHSFYVYPFQFGARVVTEVEERPFIPDDAEGRAAAAAGSCRSYLHTIMEENIAGTDLVRLKLNVIWCWQFGSITYAKRFITQESPAPLWGPTGRYTVQSSGGVGSTTWRNVVSQPFGLCAGIGPFAGCAQNITLHNDLIVGPGATVRKGPLDSDY